jgi:hypothetical protein
MATARLPQARDTGWVLHAQLQPHVVEVGSMSPTLAWGEVHHLCVRGLMAVRPAIARETRRLAMGERGCQPQTPGCRGGKEAGECRPPIGVERIEGTPEGVIMAMAGVNPGGNQARARLMLEKMGHEVQRLGEQAQTVEPHGFDCLASGHHPPFRVVLRRLLNDLSNAECFTPPRDQTQVIPALRTVRLRLWQALRAVR